MGDETTTVQDWRSMVPPIFAACVAVENGRYAIGAPWVENGRLYATDGKIAVRGPASLVNGELPPIDANFRVPPVDSIIDPAEMFFDEPTPLPEVPDAAVARIPCEHCRGIGHCNACECGEEHDCGHCEGEGSNPPDGLRIVIDEKTGYGLNHIYTHKLRKAGIDHVFLRRDGRQDRPCQFVAGKCEGALMPMKAGI